MADVRRLEFDVQLEKRDYKKLVTNNIMGRNKFAVFGMFGAAAAASASIRTKSG